MKMLCHLARTLCLLALAFTANAQQVRVVLNVAPPYPVHLEDALRLSPQTIVTLTNLGNTGQQIKLITSVTGDNGVSGKVKLSYQPAIPILLNPFETKVLTGSQLRSIGANITENDVEIKGMNVARAIQTETIPEGMYTICVRAHDYQTSAPLSADMAACVPIYITQYDPPVLIAPSAGEQVNATNPQFLNFIWTPAGVGGKTRYRFELADLTLSNLLNPNEAFDNPAIFTFKKEGLLTASFPYDMTQPPLVKNHKYAVRVTAYDPTQSISFKNGGKGPVSTFTWKGLQIIATPFDPPLDIANPDPNNPNVPPGNNPNVIVNNPPPKQYNMLPCMAAVNLQNKTPINGQGTIGPETILTIGDHSLRLTENIVWNGNKLSGWGLITNVWFKIPVKVQFTDLKVNSDKVVIDGFAYARDDNNSPIEWLNDLTQISLGEQQIQNAIQKLMGDSDKRIVEWPNTKNIGVGMPVAIKRNIGGAQQMIGIVGMVFGPGGSGLNAFCQINLPSSGQKLNLGAAGVCFTAQGLTKDALLFLADDFTINPNGNLRLVLKKGQPNDPSKGTYITMQKEGFKNMQVDGLLRLNNQRVKPVDNNLQHVEAPFKITVDNFHNFMLDNVTLVPFEVVGLPDWEFSITSLSYDHSDLQNPANIEFPKPGYNQEGNLWQGLYFKQLKVKLPEKLNPNAEITASKMVFDKDGFSGIIAAPVVFGKQTGKLGEKKWPFSIENLYVRVIKNGFEEGKFNGEIRLPITKDDFYLKYDALVSKQDNDLKYQFKLQPVNEIEFPAVIAKGTIFPETHIIVADMGNGFDPAFHLFGKLTLNTALGLNLQGYDLSFEGIEVIDLMVDKTGIHLGPNGDIKYTSPQKKIAGFDASITGDDFSLNSIGLSIGIEFTGEKSVVGGETGFHILTKWDGNMMRFDKFQLDDVSVHGDMSVVKVDGTLVFYYDDPVYGRGFKGEIDAEIKIGQGGGIGLGMELLVGNKDGLKYFYFDGQVDPLPVEIPVTASVRFFGFRGGVYHHMTRTEQGTYVPHAQTVFGIKAGVSLGLVKKEAFHAKVTLEANFNSNGLAQLLFYGDGYVFTKYQSGFEPYPGEQPIHLGVSVSFDFPKKIFNLTAEVDIKYPVQVPLIAGGGGIQIYVAGAQNWFVKIGTPVDRVQLELLGILEAGHYFMAGYNLGSIPPPPQEVMDICGITELPSLRAGNIADENNLGFAFGASYGFDTGNLDWWIFYARLAAWAGFDVMINKQDNCDGLNGWYANGQLYFGFLADVGLRFKFCKSCKTRTIPLVHAELGMIAQAGVANPFWFYGVIAGKAEFLGIIKGSFKFEVDYGKKCEGNPNFVPKPALEGIEFVKDVRPSNNSTDVSVFAEPEVALNFSTVPGKVYPLKESDDKGNVTTRYFSFPIETLRLTVADANSPLNNKILARYGSGGYPGEFKANFNGDLFRYVSKELLPPKTRLRIFTQVKIMEKINGQLVVAEENGDTDAAKDETFFTTGKEPEKITDDNVEFRYPENGQRYYLQMENNYECLIKTKKAYQAMFDLGQGIQQDKIKVKFVPIGAGATVEGQFLGYANNKIRVKHPPLQNSRVYIMQLIKEESPGKWLQANNQQQPNNQGPNQILQNPYSKDLIKQLTEKQQVLGELKLGNRERELYRYVFRTSKYNRLEAKFAAATGGQAIASPPNARKIEVKFPEGFDKADAKFLLFSYVLDDQGEGGWGIGGGDSEGNVDEELHFSNVEQNLYWKNYLRPWIYDGINKALPFANVNLPEAKPELATILLDAQPMLSQAEVNTLMAQNANQQGNILDLNTPVWTTHEFMFFTEYVADQHRKNILLPKLFNVNNPVIKKCLENKACEPELKAQIDYHLANKNFKSLPVGNYFTGAVLHPYYKTVNQTEAYAFKWKKAMGFNLN